MLTQTSGAPRPLSTDFDTDRPLAIEARGLVKRFDDTLAVAGVDIAVPEGAIYGILGPNGAGKTTTLRMLLGIIDPDEGVRRVFGHDRPHDVARLIGYLPEERGLYPAMKCDEAIAFMGALRGLPLSMTRDNLSEMVRISRESGALVLLLGMEMPPNYGTRYANEFRQMYREVSLQHKVALLPFFLKGIADGTDPFALFQADRIHPNEKAQPLMLDNVWPELSRLLNKR